ncbi:hypothetical protein M8C21_008924, partial [Ambrosia artemisiifolia]
IRRVYKGQDQGYREGENKIYIRSISSSSRSQTEAGRKCKGGGGLLVHSWLSSKITSPHVFKYAPKNKNLGYIGD